jgi:hypothetical protein
MEDDGVAGRSQRPPERASARAFRGAAIAFMVNDLHWQEATAERVGLALRPLDDDAEASRGYELAVRKRAQALTAAVEQADEDEADVLSLKALHDYKRLALSMSEPYYASRFSDAIAGKPTVRSQSAGTAGAAIAAREVGQARPGSQRHSPPVGAPQGPSVSMWTWIATAIGAAAGLASTGSALDAVVGGGIWFVIATAVVWVVRRVRGR